MALPTYWLFPWIDRRNLCFVNINSDGLIVQIETNYTTKTPQFRIHCGVFVV